MAILSPQGQARQAALTKRYLASLPERGVRIGALWRKVSRGGWQTADVQELCVEIHRLAGSAGSYGFDDLSHTASRLHKGVKRSARDPEIQIALAESVQDLLDELARVADSEDPA